MEFRLPEGGNENLSHVMAKKKEIGDEIQAGDGMIWTKWVHLSAAQELETSWSIDSDYTLKE